MLDWLSFADCPKEANMVIKCSFGGRFVHFLILTAIKHDFEVLVFQYFDLQIHLILLVASTVLHTFSY